MNILYLEDEPNEANLVWRYMQITPHRLTLVSSVEEANALLHEDFDLFLVDLRIGNERRGYDFIRNFRASGSTTPVIAVTGLSFPADVAKCYEVGCNDVLLKPFTIIELDETIKKYSG